MARMLVLYYSSYGHIEKLAHEIAAGAQEAGAKVEVRRVPELLTLEAAKAAKYKIDQSAPVAQIDELADYDAIVIGTGTRIWSHVVSNGELFGPGGWPLGQGRVAGQGGRRIFILGDAAWRSGDDLIQYHHQYASLRYDHRRPELRVRGSDDRR